MSDLPSERSFATPVTVGFGPHWLDDQTVRFRLWAPTATGGVGLSLDGSEPLPMRAVDGGGFELDVPARAGMRYAFVVPNGDGTLRVPDPASRRQAQGVHGDSVLEPRIAAYRWRHDDWRGRPWHETVLYELHVGLNGGYDGVRRRLPELAKLGVTAIELMPIAEAPGQRNWGYDGTLLYAPSSAYGTTDELRALVDEAHGLGLMMFLDVVYNHFGPDGNYLHTYAKSLFRSDIQTPWGDAIDFRVPMVREFFTANALYWLQEFRFDGLRFDAVHAISEPDWIDEMAARVRRETSSIGLTTRRAQLGQAGAAGPGERHVHLVLEHDGNIASHLRADVDAQWNDDSHHLLHRMLSGESEGYYEDYVNAPATLLARWLSSGFVYQGEDSAHRGEPRGQPSGDLSPLAFVNFLQNHDQIGNRPLGDRLTTLCDASSLQAAVALLLLCPQIPLLFDGEEVGSQTPFLYFTDHTPELAEAVRTGRRKEFGMFSARGEIPDPNDPATFEASRPAPCEGSAQWRALYQQLLSVRREHLMPRLAGAVAIGAQVLGEQAVRASWRLDGGLRLVLYTNLGNVAVTLLDAPDGDLLFAYPDGADRIARQQMLGGATTLAYLDDSPVD